MLKFSRDGTSGLGAFRLYWEIEDWNCDSEDGALCAPHTCLGRKGPAETTALPVVAVLCFSTRMDMYVDLPLTVSVAELYSSIVMLAMC